MTITVDKKVYFDDGVDETDIRQVFIFKYTPKIEEMITEMIWEMSDLAKKDKSIKINLIKDTIFSMYVTLFTNGIAKFLINFKEPESHAGNIDELLAFLRINIKSTIIDFQNSDSGEINHELHSQDFRIKG